jgi:hypothetical protein
MAAVILPIGSVIRAVATFIYGGVECQHKFHLMTTSIFPSMEVICSFFMHRIIIEIMMQKMVSEVQLFGVTCSLIPGDILFEASLTPHDPTYGAIPELGAAPIVANVAQLRTGKSGRQGRGRILIFGFPNAYIESHRKLTDFAYGQIRGLCDSLVDNFSLSADPVDFYIGVFSYKHYQSSGDATTSFSVLRYINAKSRLSSCSKRRS